MAASVTLASMLARARRLAQMEGGTTFVTDAEVEQWLNDGLRELYDLLIAARGEDYYAVNSPIYYSALTNGWALPATFFRSLEVVLYDGSTYFSAPRAELADVARALNITEAGGASSLADCSYRLTETEIELHPVPAAKTSTVVHLYYLPAMTTVGSGGSFDGLDGWEEYAVLSAAIRMLKKEGTLDIAQAFEVERARIEQRIGRLASTRDAGRPKRISDTRRDWAGRRFWPEEPRR
ncbi:MAG: hypothetical protein WC700_10400 [Gemmatimonadaceae bacterium]|jgi:hypothetical protein